MHIRTLSPDRTAGLHQVSPAALAGARRRSGVRADECRLVVNADDFGLSEGVNEAVCRLHDAGVLTSASLLVAGPAAWDAVRLAAARPALAVGLHVAVVAAPALLPPSEIPSLVSAAGRFTERSIAAGLCYTFLPRCRRDLRREITAQFAAFHDLGLPWSHVDTHRHFGLAPVVFRILLRLCATYRVPALRVPEDDFTLHRRLAPDDARRQRVLGAALAFFCRRQRPRLAEFGLFAADRCLGTFRSGRLDTRYLCRLIEALPAGNFELHCHPDRATERGRGEMAALLSPEFARALRSRGVRLVTHPQMAAMARRPIADAPQPAAVGGRA